MLDAFETERLSASRLADEDFADLCAMHQDSRVMATLGGLRSEEMTARFLETNLAHWTRHGHGLWVFRDRSNGGFAGRGGLRDIRIAGRQEVELSYSLLPEFWGRGLATETARALLEIGFGPLRLREIISFTLITNLASQRVMEKAGLTYEKDVVHEDLPHVLYRISADEHRQAGSS